MTTTTTQRRREPLPATLCRYAAAFGLCFCGALALPGGTLCGGCEEDRREWQEQREEEAGF